MNYANYPLNSVTFGRADSDNFKQLLIIKLYAMNKSTEVLGGTGQKSENHKAHSCCCGNGDQKHNLSSVNLDTVYQCPMKCEGDKTYKAPGTCPVCNMHLKQVK